MTDKLRPEQRLNIGETLRSNNGRYFLALQGDGNLVLYSVSTQKALWASGTDGCQVTEAVLQGDGNFVVCESGRALWATGTNGQSIDRLILQDDGNLVMYRSDGSVPWSTDTYKQPQSHKSPHNLDKELFLKEDLKKLRMTEKDFKDTTGVNIDDIKDIISSEKTRSSFKKALKTFLDFWIYLCLFTILFSLFLWLIVWILSQPLGIVVEEWRLNWSSALKIATCISLPLSIIMTFSYLYDKKEQKKTLIHLRVLFEDFEKYNQVVQAIEVRDKLAEVEVGITALEGRETLLETLKQMKDDLIRALKVERILRENKNIVDLNSEIFESSFTAAQVERNYERGNEYSQLINETLKIGINVRSEMKKMKESSK